MGEVATCRICQVTCLANVWIQPCYPERAQSSLSWLQCIDSLIFLVSAVACVVQEGEEAGPLLTDVCNCKGTIACLHEGCLKDWMMSALLTCTHE